MWKKIWLGVSIVLIAAVVVVAANLISRFIKAANDSTKTTIVVAPVVQKSVGMELKGCGMDQDVWLKNTNPCSVLVRRVWLNTSERTDWMKELKMGDSLRVNKSTGSSPVDQSYGLYIYNTAGGLVGFLSGKCPPSPPEK